MISAGDFRNGIILEIDGQVVGLFSSNFYILSQSLVFVNNFFNFF